MDQRRVACLLLALSLPACARRERRKAPVPEAAYEGFHDVASCYVIGGWAWDGARPDEPIKVTIFDGDEWITTILADQPRVDLIDAHKGNGYHDFRMLTPPSLRDGHPHVITVRFPDGTALVHSPKTLTCPSR